MAVQIGKALGMHVVGVAGPANAAWLTAPPPAGLGADAAVDYSRDDFAQVYKDPALHFDVVVDPLPGECGADAAAAAAPAAAAAAALVAVLLLLRRAVCLCGNTRAPPLPSLDARTSTNYNARGLLAQTQWPRR